MIRARPLREFVDVLPDAPIELEGDTDGRAMSATSGNYKTELYTFPPDPFPLLPAIESGIHLTLDSGLLADAIDQAKVAASTSEAKPVLTGIYLKINPSNITMAATDANRFAECILPLGPQDNTAGLEASGVVIPPEAFIEIAQACRQGPGQVQLSLANDGRQLLARCGLSKVASTLLAGDFPDYSRVVRGAKSRTHIKAQRLELETAIKAAHVFAHEVGSYVRLQHDGGRLVITSSRHDAGSGRAVVDVTREGPPISPISVNSRFLLDGVTACRSSIVELGFDAADAPIVMREKDSIQYTYVLMPIKPLEITS
jgi:DNA polymerase-3 subunit beta